MFSISWAINASMKLHQQIPTYLACACSIVAIILVCIINAAGNNANVTGSHAGRILSPRMNIVEFHIKNTTTDPARISPDNDPYWAWKEGYMFRWYLNSAWMEPDFTSTEIGAQNLYQGIGHSFNLTEIINLGFELAPGHRGNTTTPTFDVQINEVSTLAPLACYVVGIICLFLGLILRVALCCLGRRKGASTAVMGVILGLSVIAFAAITAASGYLTAQSRTIRDGILSSVYVVSSSIDSSFLGLAWGAVGVSAVNIGCLVLDVKMWKSRHFQEAIPLLDSKVDTPN